MLHCNIFQLESRKLQAMLRWTNKFWKWVDRQRHPVSWEQTGLIQTDSRCVLSQQAYNWKLPISKDAVSVHLEHLQHRISWSVCKQTEVIGRAVTETGCVGTHSAKSIAIRHLTSDSIRDDTAAVAANRLSMLVI